MPKRAKSPFVPWQTPDWGTRSAEECVEIVRQYVEALLEDEISWYKANTEGTRLFSRGFRVLAILFTVLGGLVPVLKSAGVFETGRTWSAAGVSFDPSQLGYVFLALAGGVALFDRFFGFSTAWMRFVETQIALQRLREQFRLEWVLGSQRAPGVSLDAAQARLLELAKRTALKAKELTVRETEAWITEFKTNLATFEKDLRAQLESARPGAIDVRLKDGTRVAGGFELKLDQLVVERRVTGGTASIGNVPPGLHKVSATASLDGNDYLSSQTVSVAPGEISSVELDLGLPRAQPQSDLPS
jgi:conflict system pore-forming effector with SLATT domain